MWHQDKNSVAQEMQQLKKVKMQQVLRELEEEEEAKLDQQFYGQAAYEQWLSSRGLQPKSSGPGTAPKEKKGGAKMKESLMKPNSVASQGSQGVTAEKGALTMSVSIEKKAASASKGAKGDRRETVADIMAEADFGLTDGETEAAKENKEEVKPVTYVNPNDWNPSPFIPPKEYVPILKDDYPRDEYTMMPVTEGGKKYFDGKHVKDEELEDDAEQLKKKRLRRPRLPKDVIQKALSADPTLYERPVVFKTKHIYDIHKKHKYSLDEKPVSEVPLHLCDDIDSQLVKMSIRFPPDPSKQYFIHRQRGSHGKASSGSSSSTSKKSDGAFTEWSPEVCPLPSLLTTLKQMSKPDHFPNLPGQSYGVSFGDLAMHWHVFQTCLNFNVQDSFVVQGMLNVSTALLRKIR